METVCLPRRLNPTCRSDRKRSDPRRILSESDIFHKKSIGSDSLLSDSFQSESDSDFVEIQRNPIKSDQIRPDFRRIPTNPDEIRVGFRRPIDLLGYILNRSIKVFVTRRIYTKMNLSRLFFNKIVSP